MMNRLTCSYLLTPADTLDHACPSGLLSILTRVPWRSKFERWLSACSSSVLCLLQASWIMRTCCWSWGRLQRLVTAAEVRHSLQPCSGTRVCASRQGMLHHLPGSRMFPWPPLLLSPLFLTTIPVKSVLNLSPCLRRHAAVPGLLPWPHPCRRAVASGRCRRSQLVYRF